MSRLSRLLSVSSVSGLVLAGSLAACSKSSSDGGGDPGTGTVTIPKNVVVIEGKSADDVQVFADHLVFPSATHPELKSKQAGDILVGDASATSASNKDGYLRKVVSVKDDGTNITIVTDRAYLTDAIQEGTLSGTLQVPTLTMTGPAAYKGTTPPATVKGGGSIKLLDFSGKSIFADAKTVDIGGGKTLGYDAHATISTGTLNFTPKFDVGAEIHPDLFDPIGSIKEAHVIATGTLDADLEFDVGFKLTSTATGDDIAKLIATKVFGKPTTTLAEYRVDLDKLHVGPIPIPVHADFKAVLECDLRFGQEVGVKVGGKASASVTAGFKYTKDAGFDPVASHTETFTQVGPDFTAGGDVYLRCAVKPSFSLNLFDMASGDIMAEAHASIGAKAECASTLTGKVSGSAQAGVSAKAHAKVDVFGLFKWEKECTLFDVESPKASFDKTFSLGTGATCTAVGDPPADDPVSSPAASCFGGGTDPGTDAGPGTDTGPSTDGGDGGTCVPTGSPPPSGWTCDAAKYGDCVCDCACGGADKDCKAGECGGCTHDACTIGDALGTTCTKDTQGGACIKSICENDSYCCEFSWTASCVAHIENGDYACTKRTCP